MEKNFRLKQIVNNKYYELTIITILAVVPILGIASDWILSVVKDKTGWMTADISFFIEYEFFSIWNATLTSVYGILRLINYFRKEENRNRWAESDTTLTILTSYTIIVCLMYTETFITDRDNILGFKEWYQVIKSVLEHWVIPVMLVFYYLTKKRNKPIGNVEFMKTKAFKTVLFPLLYELFILIRFLLLYNYQKGFYDKVKTTQNVHFLFPYAVIDPTEIGTVAFIFAAIAFPLTCFLLSAGMNKLSQITNNAIYINDLNTLKTIELIEKRKIKSEKKEKKKKRKKEK